LGSTALASNKLAFKSDVSVQLPQLHFCDINSRSAEVCSWVDCVAKLVGFGG